MKGRTTKAEIDKLLGLHSEGLTTKCICIRMGRSKEWVRIHLKNNKFKPNTYWEMD
jgi:DNA-binding CsgD family transcriptional regulator